MRICPLRVQVYFEAGALPLALTTTHCAHADEDNDDHNEEEEGHVGVLRNVRQSNRIDEMWGAGERITALSRDVTEMLTQAARSQLSSSILGMFSLASALAVGCGGGRGLKPLLSEAQSCELVEMVGELEKCITARLETALLDLISDQAKWSTHHPQHEWVGATVSCAQSLGSILQRQLRNAQKHSVLGSRTRTRTHAHTHTALCLMKLCSRG
jgi:hypothetical protein